MAGETDDRPFEVDELITVLAHGHVTVARVVVVTPPGSLLLEFVGGLAGLADGYTGSMPVTRDADGQWVELINRTPVTITRRRPWDVLTAALPHLPPAEAGSPVARLEATLGGGRVESFTPNLGDGSGCATVTYPLSSSHWLLARPAHDEYEAPPMPFRMGLHDPLYRSAHEAARAAAKYAIRATTDYGALNDFDPDALVQNFLVGLFGYATADGLSADAFANPKRGTPILRVAPLEAPSLRARLAAWWRA